MSQKTLIYDGDCGFCSSSAKWLQSKSVRFSIVQWQLIPDLSLLGLTLENVQTAAYLVDQNKVIGRGSDAISKCLSMCKFPYNFLGHLILLPGIRQIARPVYRIIAKNRHAMPGSTDSCKL